MTYLEEVRYKLLTYLADGHTIGEADTCRNAWVYTTVDGGDGDLVARFSREWDFVKSFLVSMAMDGETAADVYKSYTAADLHRNLLWWAAEDVLYDITH